MLREYSQGAAQRAVQPVADFIAPAVSVGAAIGRYKVFTNKSRFRIPETRRSVGGRAVVLDFDATDGTYNCEPHALDCPVDVVAEGSQEDIQAALQEAADTVAEVGALAHEKQVVDAALTALGAGTNVTFGANDDPIDIIDGYILNVLKAAKYGSLMSVGALFGATAWKRFKNNPAVRNKFVVGSSAKAGVGFAVPTLDMIGQLFLGNPEVRASFMVYDAAAEGLDESVSFILDNSLLLFARSPNPTRRDPSFMKTFRMRNRWMVPGTYMRDDGRVEMAKFDWSEDVQTTNSTAGIRLNITA